MKRYSAILIFIMQYLSSCAPICFISKQEFEAYPDFLNASSSEKDQIFKMKGLYLSDNFEHSYLVPIYHGRAEDLSTNPLIAYGFNIKLDKSCQNEFDRVAKITAEWRASHGIYLYVEGLVRFSELRDRAWDDQYIGHITLISLHSLRRVHKGETLHLGPETE